MLVPFGQQLQLSTQGVHYIRWYNYTKYISCIHKMDIMLVPFGQQLRQRKEYIMLVPFGQQLQLSA